MIALHEKCCGIDVHKEVIVACLMSGRLDDNTPNVEIRQFSTLPLGLQEIKSWLESEKCHHIAMESTGIFWIALYEILEEINGGNVDLLVVNARHIKNVPGRKTDIKDANWIASLLRAGLLRGSFIPEKSIRILRNLTRYRKSIIQDIVSQKNRIEKFLQSAGFRLSVFLSDIFGVSGRNVMARLVQNGFITRNELDTCLKTKTRSKIDDILASVSGKMEQEEREILVMMLKYLDLQMLHVTSIEESISEVSRQHERPLELLRSIPGIGERAAVAILAEIGSDMSNFPTAAHFSSWAGMSPGSNESAGKRKSAHINPGNRYLKSMLCEVAWGISRLRGKTYLCEWYWKIKLRRGAKRAIVALGRKLLTIIYAILMSGEMYSEDYFEVYRQNNQQRRLTRMVSELRQAGYDVKK